jgi:hypothetical protein
MTEGDGMTNVDVESLKRDDDYCVDLQQSVWLMDNHKWALYVWEIFRQLTGGGRFTLAHADYHWDGGYDFHCDAEKEQELLAADLQRLRAFIDEEEWIRYDSFIAPAVARGMFDALHFYCLQGDEWDVAVDEKLRKLTGTDQVIHETPESLASMKITSPLIFDLCLDLFNRSNQFREGDLWTDEEVLGFLDTVRPLITTAVLVTISLSFDSSGTAADTRHLASLVLPKIQAWRMAA